MEGSNQDKYYQMAIDWCNEYLKTSQTLIDYKSFDNIIIHDTHKTLNLWLYRLKESEGRDKFASFVRIKRFKDFINKEHEK